MPKWTGRYTYDPRSRYSESKGYLGALAQGAAQGDVARVLTDTDYNDHAFITHTLLRRIRQWGMHDGATDQRIFTPLQSNIANCIVLLSGTLIPSASNEQSAFYSLGGLPAIFPSASFEVLGANIAFSHAPFLYRRIVAVNANTFTDDAAMFVPGSLAGRPVEIYDRGTNTRQVLTIVSNSETEIICDGSITKPAGSYYFVRPVTPSTDGQVDTVWLDVYCDEVGAVAVPGDPEADPSLTHNVEGAMLESMRRLKLVQAVIWEQGGTALTAGKNLEPNLSAFTDGLYFYTDFNGNDHYLVKIARIYRRNGVEMIHQSDISDMRKTVGRQTRKDLERLLLHHVGDGVLGDPTSEFKLEDIGGGELKVTGGVAVVAGQIRVYPDINLTSQSSGAAWAPGTPHYVFWDEDARLRVQTELPLNSRKVLWRFTPVTPTDLISDERDYRTMLRGYGETLSLNTKNQILRLRLLAGNALHPLAGRVVFEDLAGITEIGGLASWYDELGATVYLRTLSTSGNAGLVLGIGATPGHGPHIILSKGEKRIRVLAPSDDYAVDGFAPWGGGQAPAVWRMKETHHERLVAPGLYLGLAEGTPDPDPAVPAPDDIHPIVPASRGVIVTHTLSGAATGIYPNADGATVYTSAVVLGSIPGEGGIMAPILCELPIRRRMGIGRIYVYFGKSLSSGAAITMTLQIYFRDDFITGLPYTLAKDGVPVVSSRVISDVSTEESFYVDVDMVNTHRMLYAGVYFHSRTGTHGTSYINVRGFSVHVTSFPGVGRVLSPDLCPIILGS
jgi:hypothetical protein